MKKEKVEEKKTGERRENIKTEWDQNFRAKIKKELQEVKIECNRLSKMIEEERKEMNIFREEMKEVKEMKSKGNTRKRDNKI